MRSHIRLWTIGLAVLGLAACDRPLARRDADTLARADRPVEQRAANTGSAADNTGVNTRDRAQGAVTPMDQSNQDHDLALTRQIRQAITDNDSLSTEAQNVKVITQNGVVVLRGPVENAGEKATIVAIASRTAGVSRVDDQLEVAGD